MAAGANGIPTIGGADSSLDLASGLITPPEVGGLVVSSTPNQDFQLRPRGLVTPGRIGSRLRENLELRLNFTNSNGDKDSNGTTDMEEVDQQHEIRKRGPPARFVRARSGGGGDSGEDPENPEGTNRYVCYPELLGEGAYKVVYRGMDTFEARGVAWNELKRNNKLKPEELKRVLLEVGIHCPPRVVARCRGCGALTQIAVSQPQQPQPLPQPLPQPP